MSQETVRRVAIKFNTSGSPTVVISGHNIVASIFAVGPGSGPVEPHQARAMATSMQTIAGELLRAADSVERQRIEALGGTVPEPLEPTEPTEPGAVMIAEALTQVARPQVPTHAVAAPVSFNERRLVDCYHESPGLKALVEATREPLLIAAEPVQKPERHETLQTFGKDGNGIPAITDEQVAHQQALHTARKSIEGLEGIKPMLSAWAKHFGGRSS